MKSGYQDHVTKFTVKVCSYSASYAYRACRSNPEKLTLLDRVYLVSEDEGIESGLLTSVVFKCFLGINV